ncbi:MAG: RnfABCDGE type electron transport complex subunit D [Clostridia bacterium]|nr:RnfABCDGE type electron transport complex subunit D [Clostridia bacterium]
MTKHAPFIHTGERSVLFQLDVLLMLAVLTLISYVFYGWRPVLLILCGMACATLCELLGCLLRRRRIDPSDLSCAVTGALVAMMMSPTAPYWLPAVAAAFAVLLVKLPFGGTGRNLFNPAAAGVAFVTVLFPAYMTSFPAASLNMQALPLTGTAELQTVTSPAGQWLSSGTLSLTWGDWLLGEFSGPIGAAAGIVIAACAIYLFVRRTAAPSLTLSFLLTCTAGARLLCQDWQQALLLIGATPIFFASVFLLTDPVTSPHNTPGRILYGMAAAGIVLLMRRYCAYEETVCFALLLANATAPLFDRLGGLLLRRLDSRRHREVEG